MYENNLAYMYALKNLLRAIHDSIHSDARRMAGDLELTEPQHHLLLTIYFKPGSTLSKLAEYELVNTSTIAVIVDNLCQKNLAVKYTDPRDTRLRRVYITERGEEIIKKALELAEGYRLMDIFNAMDKERKLRIIEVLNQIVKELKGEEYIEFIKYNSERLDRKVF